MKKVIKTIGLFIFMWVMLSLIGKVSAATASISASKTSATVGDKVTVTVSINAATWNLNVSGSAVDNIVGYNEDGVNKQTTKTYTVTGSKEGTSTVSLSGDVTDGTTDENSPVNGSVTITFKAKTTSNGNGTTTSSGNSTGGNNATGNSQGNSTGSNTTTQKPTFKNTSATIYTTNDTTNLRANWSTTEGAIQVPKGTELKLTGTSTENIGGYTWYKVTYNGATRYVASSLISYTKPKDEDKDNEDKKDDNKASNKNLSSLSIEGIELEPKFNKETTQYTAKVDGDVTELKINAKAENSKAKVTVEGNKDLKEGDNVIKVKVTAEDETTRTYFITVTQGEGTVTDSELRLTELKIDRVNFEGIFKPDTYHYELTLEDYVKKLDITATPNQEDAKVEISGNEEFKEGKNVVVILVTSADGSKTANYRIEVNVPAEVLEKAEEDSEMVKYIFIGVAVALAIIAFILIIMRHRNSRADEDFDEEDNQEELYSASKIGGRRFNTEDDDDYEERNNGRRFNTEENDDYEERNTERRSRRINSDVTVDDLFSSDDDSQGRESRRSRGGRHSV